MDGFFMKPTTYFPSYQTSAVTELRTRVAQQRRLPLVVLKRRCQTDRNPRPMPFSALLSPARHAPFCPIAAASCR